MDLSFRRKSKAGKRSCILQAGGSVAAAVISLALLFYCLHTRQLSGKSLERKAAAGAQPVSSEASVIYQDHSSEQNSKMTLTRLRTSGTSAEKRQPSTVELTIESNINAIGATILNRKRDRRQPESREQQRKQGHPLMKGRELKPGQCGFGLCANGTSRVEDFVFAVATHHFNEPTLISGRAGRLGMRTYVSTNYTPPLGSSYPSIDSETWGSYPDDQPLRSFYEGDTRAALVPFLAYRDLGNTFKWLFYGDDDTIFFVDAAMELVKEYDPEMPYFLTDHFWYSNWNYGYPWHPHWRAPRCLPCHSDVNTSALRMQMVKACPCTPQDMCNLDDGYDGVLDKRKCTPPRAPTLTYSMHGGAGALISIGLLKKVSLEQMEDCALRDWNTGGDSFITSCLWQAGYGMTDPGPTWHPEGLTRFDPSPRKLMIDHTPYVIPRAAYTIGNLLAKAAGVCGTLCKEETDHVLSLHLRARLLTNTSFGAGVFIRAVARFYNLKTGRMQGEPGALRASLRDVHDEAAARLATAIDKKFADGVATLRDVIPHLKEVAKRQIAWPSNGGASLFIPTSKQPAEKGDVVYLSEEDLIKGGAAGIAQNLLDDILKEALAQYPPPPLPS